MFDPNHPLAELLREDRRYKFDAYVFVFEALNYGQTVLGMGSEAPSEQTSTSPYNDEDDEDGEDDEDEAGKPQQHVTGQDLCQAIRHYALDQFGMMAKTVLDSWGIRNTGDFGEIVFNLIRVGRMRKTPDDRREDFEDVYDFDEAFKQEFRMTPESEE